MSRRDDARLTVVNFLRLAAWLECGPDCGDRRPTDEEKEQWRQKAAALLAWADQLDAAGIELDSPAAGVFNLAYGAAIAGVERTSFDPWEAQP